MTTESTAQPSGTPPLSEARGETAVPLLEETIGDNFRRTTATYAEREALVEVAS